MAHPKAAELAGTLQAHPHFDKARGLLLQAATPKAQIVGARCDGGAWLPSLLRCSPCCVALPPYPRPYPTTTTNTPHPPRPSPAQLAVVLLPIVGPQGPDDGLHLPPSQGAGSHLPHHRDAGTHSHVHRRVHRRVHRHTALQSRSRFFYTISLPSPTVAVPPPPRALPIRWVRRSSRSRSRPRSTRAACRLRCAGRASRPCPRTSERRALLL